jgi:hypothetical protein
MWRAERHCLPVHLDGMLLEGTRGSTDVAGGGAAMTRTWTVDDVTTGPTEAVAAGTPVLAGWLEHTYSDTDAAIARQAELSLRNLLQLADCGLRVADGVIYVAGRVHRRSEAEALLVVLNRLPGVRALRGRIQCDTDDTGRQAFPPQDADGR